MVYKKIINNKLGKKNQKIKQYYDCNIRAPYIEKKSRTFRAHSRHEVHILMNPGIVNLSRFGKDEKIGVIYKINI